MSKKSISYHSWHLSLVCSSCHTNIDEIYFSGNDEIEVAHSRGMCNF